MSRILITGGAGFIGSHIAEELSGEASVVIYDNLSSGKLRNIQELDVELIEGDICDAGALSAACKDVEIIFHLAARTSVAESMHDPSGTVRINTLGTINVLEAAVKQGARCLVFSSSAAIYGDNPSSPKREEMRPEPKSPYAVTKLDGEHYLKIFREKYALQTVTLRYFNVFGPRQDPDSPYAAAIPSFIERALKGEELIIYGDGEQSRDFVFVSSVVRANLLAAGMGRAGPAAPLSTATSSSTSLSSSPESSSVSDSRSTIDMGVYNVGCGRSITINDLARQIIAITRSESQIRYAPSRPGDVRHSLADISSIRKCLGYEPPPGSRDELEKTVRYFSTLIKGEV